MPKLQRELYYPTKSHLKLLPSKVYMVRNIAHQQKIKTRK